MFRLWEIALWEMYSIFEAAYSIKVHFKQANERFPMLNAPAWYIVWVLFLFYSCHILEGHHTLCASKSWFGQLKSGFLFVLWQGQLVRYRILCHFKQTKNRSMIKTTLQNIFKIYSKLNCGKFGKQSYLSTNNKGYAHSCLNLSDIWLFIWKRFSTSYLDA